MVFFDKKSIENQHKTVYDSSGMPQKTDVVLYDLLLK